MKNRPKMLLKKSNKKMVLTKKPTVQLKKSPSVSPYKASRTA